MSGKWFLAVIGDNVGSTPAVVIVPRDAATYEAVTRPLRRDGWVRPSRHEQARGAWTVAPNGALDVVDHKVVRVFTGKAHVFAVGEPVTTPMWRSAARERRAVVAVVPHDSLPDDDYSGEQVGDRLIDLAGQRAVTAALVTVRFDEFTGPYPKEWGGR